jgi:hypothetical protein
MHEIVPVLCFFLFSHGWGDHDWGDLELAIENSVVPMADAKKGEVADCASVCFEVLLLVAL